MVRRGDRTGPLSGLLVADFSRILAGPYATMLLADLGAEVVKVESPAGDDTRTWSPPVRDGVSTYYLGVNRNKRSVALDLKDDTTSRRPASWPAAPTCSSRTSSPAAWPASAWTTPASRATNPGVVYASISGFGSGPGGRDLPGYDLMVQAISGLMSLTGDPDGPPYRAGISVFDVMAGLHATIGVLAALNARARHGRGQHVEVNLLSSALSGLVNQSSAFVAGGVVPTRMGNSHPSLFPYEPLPCADGDLIITAGNNGQFRRARRGARRARARRRPPVPRQRGPHRAPRRAAAAARRAPRHPHHHGVVPRPSPPPACRAARSTPSTGGSRSPSRSASTRSSSVGEGDAAVPSVRNPIRLSATPADYRLPPPGLDEHGDEIRRWLAEPATGTTGA